MPMNEEQQKKFTAIIRQLKKQKGLTIKHAELNEELKFYKDKQKEVKAIKAGSDNKVVHEEADKQNKKLQNIIDDLNDYMKVLHPEGLLDYGTGAGGQVVGQG